MKYETYILAAALTVFVAPVASQADMIDFDSPSFSGSKLDANLLSGKWADNPDECKTEPDNSAEAVGCNYALMTTYKNPTSHVIAELCYAEDMFENPGRFKTIRPIDNDTIAVKSGTEWISPDETVPTYKRCPND